MNKILQEVGIDLSNNDVFLFIPREELLSCVKYEKCKEYLDELRKENLVNISCRNMTSLQKNPETKQKWPLLNLVRQILLVCGYEMEPVRKSDGYVKGVKKYKRFFQIQTVKKLED